MVDYTITDNCLTIKDSHKVSKFKFCGILKQIRSEHPMSDVWKRSIFSLSMEWTCHSFLYEIGYERERTGTVDLDYPCDHPEWMYILCGILVWPITFKTK